MEMACYLTPEGIEVTPQRFHELAGSDYIRERKLPYCGACREVVHLYGIHNWDISRFDHQNRDPGLSELDDCVRANRVTRFRGMWPDSWDNERGRLLRKNFFEDENLKLAYSFCLQLTRKGNLPLTKFNKMIRRADTKRIWSYANIPLWVVPYILLTLENFSQENTATVNAYDFHFVFNKPRNTTASALWEQSHATTLKKVFRNGDAVSTRDNPFPLSEVKMIEKAGDTSWVTPDFLLKLKAMQ